LQVDSDVLFFSKPVEILDTLTRPASNGCYNADVGNAYTFDTETIKKYLSRPVINNFNAGLFMHNFDGRLFDFAETVLQKEPGCTTSWHLEQTLFVMYAGEKGGFGQLPPSYDVAGRQRKRGNKLISEHYCHHTGYDFHKDFIYQISPEYTKRHTRYRHA
jgi:hypothetical protein